ncbi:macB [Symbiodinium microadriaticum]|nr:macB [Symbiodinium microadriaticum]
MLKNYFKLAIRNIQRHTSYAVINLLGLSVGFGASIIIGLYALDILTFNAAHHKKDQIYLAYKERLTPSGTQATYDTWIPMAQRLQSEFPEINKTSTSYQTEAMVISSTQEYIREAITYTDESFFEIFTFQSIQNNPRYFDGRYSAVITENMAAKYFPNQNAVGNELEIYLNDEDTTMRFMVSSVVKNLPTNAAPDTEIFIPFEGLPAYKEFQNNWNSSFASTWVLLEGQNPITLESRFADLVSTIWDAETATRTNFRLLPLEEYYDTFIGDSDDAWIMMGIAIGILLIASINFMNLATARSTYRAKEIGLRKVLGAIAPQIRIQFFMESVIYTVIALGIAMIIVFFALPYVNTFFELNLNFFQLISVYGLLALLGITLFIGILSGSYPAFFLSTISVIQVLRKSGITGGARSFRNALIVVQFGLAVLLICGALLIRNQLMYMYQKDMGFDSEQLLFIEASTDNFSDREIGASRINTFKKNLSGYSFVQKMTSSRSIPTDWTRSFTFVRSKGWTGDPLRMRYTYVDANFFDTYDIEIVDGRNFLDDLQGHQRESVILNRAAFEDLNLDTAIAPTLVFGSREIKVVGIADNFNFESREGQIWGQLVPYGKANLGFGVSSTDNPSPWRAGANENTTIEFSHDVLVQGQEIEAGKYGFFVEPNQSAPWKIIFSKETNAWGSFFYTPDDEVLVVEAEPEDTEFREFLTFEFTDRQPNQTTAALAWENLRLPFTIEVQEANDVTLTALTSELKNSGGFSFNNWAQAANWASNAGYHDQALVWAENAISLPFIGQKNFATMQTKATVLRNAGKTDEAITVMDEAIDMPGVTAFQIHAYGRALIAADQKDKALEVFKKNHKMNDGVWPTNYGLARGYSAVGDYKNALKYLEIAKTKVPENDTLNPPVIDQNIEKLKKGEDIN